MKVPPHNHSVSKAFLFVGMHLCVRVFYSNNSLWAAPALSTHTTCCMHATATDLQPMNQSATENKVTSM